MGPLVVSALKLGAIDPRRRLGTRSVRRTRLAMKRGGGTYGAGLSSPEEPMLDFFADRLAERKDDGTQQDSVKKDNYISKIPRLPPCFSFCGIINLFSKHAIPANAITSTTRKRHSAGPRCKV